MHELLTSRGFVRRADALDLAEVKEKEAAADAAAAVARKERAEAAAKRKLDRGKATKLTQEEEAAMVRTTVVSVFVRVYCFFAGSRQRVTGSLSKGNAKVRPASTVFCEVCNKWSAIDVPYHVKPHMFGSERD